MPVGRPGHVTDAVSLAREAGFMDHPTVSHLANEFWVRDGTRSFWRESLEKRLPLLINSAFRHLDAIAELDLDEWTDQLTGAVGMYLAAIEGEPIDYLNVYQIRLELDQAIQTPWGLLRPGTTRDRPWIEEMLTEELHFSTEWDRRNAVLQVAYPVKWKTGTPKDEQIDRHPNGIHYGITDREPAEPDLVCLAALLIGGHASYGSVCWAGTYFLPFGSSGWGCWVQRDQLYEAAIFKPNPDDLLESTERISERFVSGRHLAVSRIISACDRQRNPVDGIVDCVIALENLLLRGSGEMAFKIAAAASTLMTDDPVERTKVFADFKRLYTTRSRIVHGSKALPRAEASVQVRDAIDLTLDLIRASLTHDQDVWSMDQGDIEKMILTR